MTVRYATVDQFQDYYNVEAVGINSSEVYGVWLPYGSLRVNERLSKSYATPFSSNNFTARDLSIHYAYLGILLRTRNIEDSEELKADLDARIADIIGDNGTMINDDGSELAASENTLFTVYSSTQNYKPTFDMRGAIDQRVDPDLIDDLWAEDV
jgi:hypothetical protein